MLYISCVRAKERATLRLFLAGAQQQANQTARRAHSVLLPCWKGPNAASSALFALEAATIDAIKGRRRAGVLRGLWAGCRRRRRLLTLATSSPASARARTASATEIAASPVFVARLRRCGDRPPSVWWEASSVANHSHRPPHAAHPPSTAAAAPQQQPSRSAARKPAVARTHPIEPTRPPAAQSLPPLLHPSAFSTARRISFLGQPASLQPAAATSTTTHSPPDAPLHLFHHLAIPSAAIHTPPAVPSGCRSLCRRLAETLSHPRVCWPSPPLTTASSPSSQLPSSRTSTSRARFSTPNRRIRSLARHRRSTSLYRARAARPSKTPPVVHTF